MRLNEYNFTQATKLSCKETCMINCTQNNHKIYQFRVLGLKEKWPCEGEEHSVLVFFFALSQTQLLRTIAGISFTSYLPWGATKFGHLNSARSEGQISLAKINPWRQQFKYIFPGCMLVLWKVVSGPSVRESSYFVNRIHLCKQISVTFTSRLWHNEIRNLI